MVQIYRPAAGLSVGHRVLPKRGLVDRSATEEEDLSFSDPDHRSLVRRASMGALSGLAATGNLLDLPASVIRDAATLLPGGPAPNNPLDQLLPSRWFSPEGRTTAEDFYKSAGFQKYPVRGFFPNLGRFAVNVGTEIAFDPLTYVTGGASASGHLLRRAGLIDDLLPAARAAGLGKKIGPREAMMKMTPREVADFSRQTKPERVLASQQLAHDRLKAAAGGVDEVPDEVLDAPLAEGAMRFRIPSALRGPHGLFGGEKGLLDVGVGGERTARAMDRIGEAVRYGKYSPVRKLAPIFSKPLRGAQSAEAQKAAKETNRKVEESLAFAREHMHQPIQELYATGLLDVENIDEALENAYVMRDYLEDVGRGNRPITLEETGGMPRRMTNKLRHDLFHHEGLTEEQIQYVMNEHRNKFLDEGMTPSDLNKSMAEAENNLRTRGLYPDDIDLLTTRDAINILGPDDAKRVVDYEMEALEDFAARPQFDRIRDALPSLDVLRREMDNILEEAERAGVKLSELEDPLVRYFPREYQTVAGPFRRSRDVKPFDPHDPFAIARREHLRDIPGGTSVLMRMSVDEKVAGIFDKKIMGGAKRNDPMMKAKEEEAWQYFKEKYGPMMGVPDDVMDRPQSQFRKLFKTMTERSMEDVKSKTPMFIADPAASALKRMESAYMAHAQARGIMNLFKDAASVRRLGQQERVHREALNVFGNTPETHASLARLHGNAQLWASKTGRPIEDYYKRVQIKRGADEAGGGPGPAGVSPSVPPRRPPSPSESAADEMLESIDAGGSVPAMKTAALKRMAKDLGVEDARSKTPKDLVDEIRAKRQATDAPVGASNIVRSITDAIDESLTRRSLDDFTLPPEGSPKSVPPSLIARARASDGTEDVANWSNEQTMEYINQRLVGAKHKKDEIFDVYGVAYEGKGSKAVPNDVQDFDAIRTAIGNSSDRYGEDLLRLINSGKGKPTWAKAVLKRVAVGDPDVDQDLVDAIWQNKPEWFTEKELGKWRRSEVAARQKKANHDVLRQTSSYTTEELMDHSVAELKDIAKGMGITNPGTTKAKLSKSIMQATGDRAEEFLLRIDENLGDRRVDFPKRMKAEGVDLDAYQTWEDLYDLRHAIGSEPNNYKSTLGQWMGGDKTDYKASTQRVVDKIEAKMDLIESEADEARRVLGEADAANPDNPAVRMLFEKGFVLARLEDLQGAKNKYTKELGDIIGLEPAVADEVAAVDESPFMLKQYSVDHPRRVKFEHRETLKESLGDKYKSLVTAAKRSRNTQSQFVDQYSDMAHIVKEKTGLTMEGFWRHVNHGPAGKPIKTTTAKIETPDPAVSRASLMTERIVEGLRQAGVPETEIAGMDPRKAWKRLQESKAADPDKLYQTAWHGSPHHFDKFTLDHIGSGEGAQAFGWGLYFADSRGVANYYKEMAQRRSPLVTYRGKPLDATTVGGGVSQSKLALRIVDEAQRLYGDMSPYSLEHARLDILDEMDEEISYYVQDMRRIDRALAPGYSDIFDKYDDVTHRPLEQGSPEWRAALEQQRQAASDIVQRRRAAAGTLRGIDVNNIKIGAKKKGKLYKVDLSPSDDDYLLWDKPLSQQSEKVKAALARIGIKDADVSDEKISAIQQQLHFLMESKMASGKSASQYSTIDDKIEQRILQATNLGLDVQRMLSLDPGGSHYVVTRPSRTGREVYHQLKGFVGREGERSDKAASLALHQEGVRGIKYFDQGSRAAKRGTSNYVIFDEADVTINEILEQTAGGIRKGEIDFTEFAKGGPAIIRAFEAADATTFAHEAGHLFRRALAEADTDLLKRAEEAFGVPNGNWNATVDWGGEAKKAEEAFAEAWEMYTANPKRAQRELSKLGIGEKAVEIFERMKEWVASTWASLRGTGIESTLSPEMRRLLDEIAPDSPVDMDVTNALDALKGTPFAHKAALSKIVSDMDPHVRGQAERAVYENRIAQHQQEILATQREAGGAVDDYDTFFENMLGGADKFHQDLAAARRQVAADPDFEMPSEIDGIPLEISDAEMVRQMQLPSDVAKDLTKTFSELGIPDSLKPIQAAWDSYIDLFKTHVTATNLGFHVRNFVSGMFQNVFNGVYDPNKRGLPAYLQIYKDAGNLMTGHSVEKATQLPLFKDRVWKNRLGDVVTGDEAEELATEELRKMSFAFGLLESPGQHRDLVAHTMAEPLASTVPGLVKRKGLLDYIIKRSAPPKDASRFDRLFNIGKVAGGIGARDQWFLARYGRSAGDAVEAGHRVGGFIQLLKQGYDPAEAARKIKLLHVDYTNLSTAEREIFRRTFPFYSFTRGMLEFLGKELSDRPGGPTAMAIKAANRATDEDVSTPDYVSEGLSFPAGVNPDGTRHYITGLGLMHEAPVNLLTPDPQAAVFGLMGQLNPIIKAPLELALNESLFQSSPQGGRSLDDMDPLIGRLASNLQESGGMLARGDVKGLALGADSDKPPKRLGKLTELVASNSPISRYLSTARVLADPRKNLLQKGAAATSGFRITSVSPGAQDAVLRERIEQLMRKHGGKVFERAYIPENVLANMSDEERELAEQMMELMRLLGKRTKQRKRQRELSKQERTKGMIDGAG